MYRSVIIMCREFSDVHVPLSSSSSFLLLFRCFLFPSRPSNLSVFPFMSFLLFFPFNFLSLSCAAMSFNFFPFLCFFESFVFLFFLSFDFCSSSLLLSSSLSSSPFWCFLESPSRPSTLLSLSSCEPTPLLLAWSSCGLC